jgi:hypothetical protein
MSAKPHSSAQPSDTNVTRCFNGDLPTPYPRHVEEFQGLYQQSFGTSLSSQQALRELISLLLIANYRHQNGAYKATQKPK